MSVPYNDNPRGQQWTDQAYELQKERKLHAEGQTIGGIAIVRVQGECPYCHDEMSVTYAETAVSEGTDTLTLTRTHTATRPPEWRPIVATCGCAETHAGNPTQGAPGCGTTFAISALFS